MVKKQKAHYRNVRTKKGVRKMLINPWNKRKKPKVRKKYKTGKDVAIRPDDSVSVRLTGPMADGGGFLFKEDVNMPSELDEYYEVLGLDKGASKDDLKKRYRQAAMMYHPDVNHEPWATDVFIKVKDAFEELNKHFEEVENKEERRKKRAGPSLIKHPDRFIGYEEEH